MSPGPLDQGQCPRPGRPEPRHLGVKQFTDLATVKISQRRHNSMLEAARPGAAQARGAGYGPGCCRNMGP